MKIASVFSLSQTQRGEIRKTEIDILENHLCKTDRIQIAESECEAPDAEDLDSCVKVHRLPVLTSGMNTFCPPLFFAMRSVRNVLILKYFTSQWFLQKQSPCTHPRDLSQVQGAKHTVFPLTHRYMSGRQV